jgi:hypothetical protein
MKTIQEYLKGADVVRLVQEYFTIHPINYGAISDKDNLTVNQIRTIGENRMTEYIHKLQSLEITPSDDGKEYILFAHKCIIEGIEDEAYSLVCKQELLEKGTEATTYAYEYSKHSEVMGYMVSEAEFTQKNIYGLMADVLFESSFFGYDEKDLEKARQELEESIEEVKNGKTVEVSMEELFENEKEDTDEIEERLYNEFTDAENNYDWYCLKKEMEILKMLILGVAKDEENEIIR